AVFRASRVVQRSLRSATASPTTAPAAAAVTAQPSAETGDSPQPTCLGPNQAFRPSSGLVLIAARRPSWSGRSGGSRRQGQRSPWAGGKPIFAPRPHVHQNRAAGHYQAAWVRPEHAAARSAPQCAEIRRGTTG